MPYENASIALIGMLVFYLFIY